MNRHWNRKALLLLALTQRFTQRCLAASRYRQAMETESAIAAHPSLCLARSTSLTDSTTVGFPYKASLSQTVESENAKTGILRWSGIWSPCVLGAPEFRDMYARACACANESGSGPVIEKQSKEIKPEFCRALKGADPSGAFL